MIVVQWYDIYRTYSEFGLSSCSKVPNPDPRYWCPHNDNFFGAVIGSTSCDNPELKHAISDFRIRGDYRLLTNHDARSKRQIEMLDIRAGWFIQTRRVLGGQSLPLNISPRRPHYFGSTYSISWLPMPWLLVSQGHQQPWQWLCRIGKFQFLSSMRKDFNYLCHVSAEERYRL